MQLLFFRILARNSIRRSGKWSRTVSPSLRPSQSCPQDVCQILKESATTTATAKNATTTTTTEDNEPTITINDVTNMTSHYDNDVTAATLARGGDSIPKRQTALTLEVGGIRCVVVSPSPVSEVVDNGNEDDNFPTDYQVSISPTFYEQPLHQ